jgi:hypothetical protein
MAVDLALSARTFGRNRANIIKGAILIALMIDKAGLDLWEREIGDTSAFALDLWNVIAPGSNALARILDERGVSAK